MTTMISRLLFVRKNVRTAWAAFLAGLLLSSSITSAQWSENAVIEWKAPPDNWELIGYSPVFEDAVWAGEQYLAITSSFVSRSSDGRGWEHQTMTSDFSLNAIETGAGRTVVVGTFGGIAHSTDGVTWQRVGTGDTGTFHGVAFGNGLWLAVGPGIIFTSPNGVDWTQRSFSSPSPGGMGVAFGNGIFVTVGNDASFTTVDAEAWQSHSAPAFGGNDVEALTFLNDAFFAATEEAVFRSVDGTTWERVLETEPEASVNNFAFARGRYLGVGDDRVYSSVDGQTWGYDIFPKLAPKAAVPSRRARIIWSFLVAIPSCARTCTTLSADLVPSLLVTDASSPSDRTDEPWFQMTG